MIAILLTLVLGAPAAGSTRPGEASDVTAFVGGRIHTVSGAVIENGTVLVRGELILSVFGSRAGEAVPPADASRLRPEIPRGARTIDCAGKVLTPGLVDSDTGIGVHEVSSEQNTVDQTVGGGDPIHAAISMADAVNPRSTLVAVARRHGITSAIAVPAGGFIMGRSAWVNLVDERSRFIDDAVIADVAMHVNWGLRGAQTTRGSRSSAALLLREVFEDARRFGRDRGAFERNSLYRLSASRLDLIALQPVVAGKLRMVFAAGRAADLVTAARWSKREGVPIAIVGGEEAWMVADVLAAEKIPVIVDPTADLPANFESRGSRADNASLLHKAGVPVALSTRTSHQVSSLRFLLGNAVRAGLPPEVALKAATLVPAQIFGQGKTRGAIEKGYVADLVVWSGDPFEPTSHAELVFIRGEAQSTLSRQTELANRYLKAHGLPKAK